MCYRHAHVNKPTAAENFILANFCRNAINISKLLGWVTQLSQLTFPFGETNPSFTGEHFPSETITYTYAITIFFFYYKICSLTIISVVLFSFIVHDPREIMEWTRDRSLFSSCFM